MSRSPAPQKNNSNSVCAPHRPQSHLTGRYWCIQDTHNTTTQDIYAEKTSAQKADEGKPKRLSCITISFGMAVAQSWPTPAPIPSAHQSVSPPPRRSHLISLTQVCVAQMVSTRMGSSPQLGRGQRARKPTTQALHVASRQLQGDGRRKPKPVGASTRRAAPPKARVAPPKARAAAAKRARAAAPKARAATAKPGPEHETQSDNAPPVQSPSLDGEVNHWGSESEDQDEDEVVSIFGPHPASSAKLAVSQESGLVAKLSGDELSDFDSCIDQVLHRLRRDADKDDLPSDCPEFRDAAPFKFFIGSASARSNFQPSRFMKVTASNFDLVMQQARAAGGKNGRLGIAWTVRREEESGGTPAPSSSTAATAKPNNKATKPVEYRLLVSVGITAVVPKSSTPTIFTVQRDNTSFEEISLTKDQADLCTDASSIEKMLVFAGSGLGLDHVLPNSVHVWCQGKEKAVEAIGGSSHCVFFKPPPTLKSRMRTSPGVEYMVLGVAVGFCGPASNVDGNFTWDANGIRHVNSSGKGKGKSKTDLHNDYGLQLRRVQTHCTQLAMQGRGVFTAKHQEAWALAITKKLLPTDLTLQEPLWGPRALGQGLEPPGAWGPAHRCALLAPPTPGDGHPSQHAATLSAKKANPASASSAAAATAPSTVAIKPTSVLQKMNIFELLQHSMECAVNCGQVDFGKISEEKERIFIHLDRVRFERAKARSSQEALEKASMQRVQQPTTEVKKVATLDALAARMAILDEAITSTDDLIAVDSEDFAEFLQTDAAKFVSILGARKIREEHRLRREDWLCTKEKEQREKVLAAPFLEFGQNFGLSPETAETAAPEGPYTSYTHWAIVYKVFVNGEFTPSAFTRAETFYTHAVLTDGGMPQEERDDMLCKIAAQLRLKVVESLGTDVDDFQVGMDPFTARGTLFAGIQGNLQPIRSPLALLHLLRKAAWQIDAQLDEHGGFDYDALGQTLDAMTGNVHSPGAENSVVIEICASAASAGAKDPAIEVCASATGDGAAAGRDADGLDARGTKREVVADGSTSTSRKKQAFAECVYFGADAYSDG